MTPQSDSPASMGPAPHIAGDRSANAKRTFARSVLAAWAAITPRQMVATFLLGVALFVYHVGIGLADSSLSLGDLFLFVADQIKVWPLLLAFAVVEHLSVPGGDRRTAYALAALAGTCIAAPLAVVWMSGMTNAFLRPAHPRIRFMIAIGLETAMLGAAILWIINDRRLAQRAQMRMHRAEMDRIAAQKRSIESGLQAMQARVEPQFLFNTLAQVRGLYRADPARGTQMLDNLITYLRAAMPKMRDTSSTVGQELELARAYLDIVKVRLGDRFTWAIECAAQARDARFPPMLLLPLIDHAIARGFERSSAAGSIAIRVASGTDVAATIAHSGMGFGVQTAGEDIERLRERLAALFAGRASLELEEIGHHATRAVVRIPAEAPDSLPAGAA
ncbi:MAG TPA: histidine kinase [Casimicrobiaceae bacterium]